MPISSSWLQTPAVKTRAGHASSLLLLDLINKGLSDFVLDIGWG